VNKDDVLSKLDKDNNYELTRETVSIFDIDDIEFQIQSVNSEISTIEYDSITIDKPNNILQYETDDCKGIMVLLLPVKTIKLADIL